MTVYQLKKRLKNLNPLEIGSNCNTWLCQVFTYKIIISIPLKSGLIVIKEVVLKKQKKGDLNPLEIGSNCNSDKLIYKPEPRQSQSP